ncbi:MAG TPA: cardiolipin synthase [Verrucomicrobiae bacterium]|nr:cardiolipin synthase [Verrucomicrobiae bacterium]
MFQNIRRSLGSYLEGRPTARNAANIFRKRRVTTLICIWIFAHLVGALTSIRAIMDVRTPQGTIAWVTALNATPFVSVPAYWVFGRSKFEGYVLTRRKDLAQTNPSAAKYMADLQARGLLMTNQYIHGALVEKLAQWRFTVGNDADLLINGDATFKSILAGIDGATNYVLVEFYIFRQDQIGRELTKHLADKARQGVRVHLLFDELGSPEMRGKVLEEIRTTGIHAHPFNTRQGADNLFQVNFRNHRKIVVVDGQQSWIGGINVGDEYLGRDPKFGNWRDTHVKVTGPAAQGAQVAFMEDWHWASGEVLNLTWDPRPAPSGANRIAITLPTGPADNFETCTLFFLNAINLATNKLWIATPYFVPDEQFVSALQLAALRGVDVRILVPDLTDNKLVQYSGWSYLPNLEKAGIKTFRYKKDFMHQKVVLIDDLYCTIGTANFDNRSFRLNFEITMGFADGEFAGRVRKMLEADFANAEEVHSQEFEQRGFWTQFALRGARVMAPIQ